MSLSTLAQLICFNPLGAALTFDEEAFITQHQITSFVLFARNILERRDGKWLAVRMHFSLYPRGLA